MRNEESQDYASFWEASIRDHETILGWSRIALTATKPKPTAKTRGLFLKSSRVVPHTDIPCTTQCASDMRSC